MPSLGVRVIQIFSLGSISLSIHLLNIYSSLSTEHSTYSSKLHLSSSYKELTLLGFGCSKTSVCLKIFSVQFLVQSPLAIRFSRWASSSVFSAWPSFSSVNWQRKRNPHWTSWANALLTKHSEQFHKQGYDDATFGPNRKKWRQNRHQCNYTPPQMLFILASADQN